MQSKTDKELTVESGLFKIKPPDSLHNSCRAVWVCKRCGNCALHCKHYDLANFHEDLDLPCSGPCQCIDCVPCVAGTEVFRIKPLEWEWRGDDYEGRLYQTWAARSILGTYTVGRYVDVQNWTTWLVKTFDFIGFAASPEEGKQLAEVHW